MHTREMARQVRLSQWAGMMGERRDSGKSIRSWCREKGINEKTWYYWQRKLREAACEQVTETGLISPRFTEVRLKEVSAVPALSEATSDLRAEIDGIRIIVGNGYPPERLALLLRELRRQC